MHPDEGADSGRDLDYYRSLLWRTKMTVLAWASAGALVGLLVAWILPTQYESTATIIIEDPEIPPNLIGSTVTSFAEKRLEIINQRIMTMRNLARIIKDFDLYPDLRRDRPVIMAVERLREDFELEKVNARLLDPRSGRPMSALISFNLTYRNRSPRTAQKVTRELARLYLAYNYSERREQADDVAEFLVSEADRLAGRVKALEDRLASFKQKYPAFVAGQGQVMIDLIDRTEAQIRDTAARISALGDRRVLLERELEIAEAVPADDVRGRMTLPQMRAELARVSQIYGAAHPDVVLLKRRIEAVTSGREPGGAEIINPAATRVRAQLATIESEAARLELRKAQLEKKLKTYEAKAMASPRLEQRYLELARDYDNAKAQYDETRRKQLVAEQARVLEKSKKGERFTLLEPPQIPRRPAGPGAALIAGGGFGLFFVLGLIVVLLRDLLDDRIHSSRQLQAVIGAEPLMLVPVLRTEADRHRRLAPAGNRRQWRLAGPARPRRTAA